MCEGSDAERAEIRIRSWGGMGELRIRDEGLIAVAEFSSMDLRRLLEAIQQAESLRIEPDSKFIECIGYVMDRIDYVDEEMTRLYLNVEAEMPIASGGSVMLSPKDSDQGED